MNGLYEYFAAGQRLFWRFPVAGGPGEVGNALNGWYPSVRKRSSIDASPRARRISFDDLPEWAKR